MVAGFILIPHVVGEALPVRTTASEIKASARLAGQMEFYPMFAMKIKFCDSRARAAKVPFG
jgi:hypothetical protein